MLKKKNKIQKKADSRLVNLKAVKFLQKKRQNYSLPVYGKKPYPFSVFDIRDIYRIPLACLFLWVILDLLWQIYFRHINFFKNHFYFKLPIIIGIPCIFLFFIFIKKVFRGLKKRSRKRNHCPHGSLWLGTTTGHLVYLHHGAGLAARQSVVLTREDASQNIIILGAIGSGKTTCAIHPLLLQLLDQGCGGLVFDIKGDFRIAVQKFSKLTNRPFVCIGPQDRAFNLLAGLTPELGASFLKSVFILGTHNRGDSFWIDTATELCRHTLGMLSFLPQFYSLHGLYQYLFEPKSYIKTRIQKLQGTLSEPEERLLKTYISYHDNVFSYFDEKVKAGVYATIAQVLSPFNHPQLIDSFCSFDASALALEDILNGAVYLVDLPLSQWGISSKVIYTLLKLRFYNIMQQRCMKPDWNQENPVFFLCDEFQEIVTANRDGLSDLNFWDKSRSSKTIGIISAQSVSSFYAAIGDRDVTHALLQNFRQKLCFRTEDQATLDYLNQLAGQVEVPRRITSKSYSERNTETQSITYTQQYVITPQLIRLLNPQHCIALLSLVGRSRDDILEVKPVYV